MKCGSDEPLPNGRAFKVVYAGDHWCGERASFIGAASLVLETADHRIAAGMMRLALEMPLNKTLNLRLSPPFWG